MANTGDVLEWVKALAPIAAAGAVLWRAGIKQGKIETWLEMLVTIKQQTDRIPQIETTVGMVHVGHTKLASEFPKAIRSIDRRVYKLEVNAEIDPTGRYIVPPFDGNGEAE